MGDIVLDVISKVSHQPHSVFKLDVKGLIVDSSPLSVNNLGIAFLTTLAEDSLSLIALQEIDSVDLFVSE